MVNATEQHKTVKRAGDAKRWKMGLRQVCNLDGLTGEDLTEKVTFKYKLKENKGGACGYGESGAKNIAEGTGVNSYKPWQGF